MGRLTGRGRRQGIGLVTQNVQLQFLIRSNRSTGAALSCAAGNNTLFPSGIPLQVLSACRVGYTSCPKLHCGRSSRDRKQGCLEASYGC